MMKKCHQEYVAAWRLLMAALPHTDELASAYDEVGRLEADYKFTLVEIRHLRQEAKQLPLEQTK